MPKPAVENEEVHRYLNSREKCVIEDGLLCKLSKETIFATVRLFTRPDHFCCYNGQWCVFREYII